MGIVLIGWGCIGVGTTLDLRGTGDSYGNSGFGVGDGWVLFLVFWL